MLNPVCSWACGCGYPLPDNFVQMASPAKAIFLGKVTKIDMLPSVMVREDMQNLQPERVHFLASKAWKGVDKSDVIIETTIGQESACEGYLFEVGRTYLVVTDSEGSMHVDHECSLTRRLKSPPSDEDMKYINSLGKPEEVFARP